MHIVLLGAPGAGKGTQADTLCEKFNLVHVASGDLFREAASAGTELGKKAKSYMEKGLLVPDDITISLIKEKVDGLGTAKGVLLDGFPRTLEQAKALDKNLEVRGKKVDKAVFINVSSDELLRRLSGRWICRQCQAPYHMQSAPPRVAGRCDKCGGELYQRADDTADTVKKRLEVYFAQTSPLIDYYRQKGKLVEVKGEGDPRVVGKGMLKALSGTKQE
ncbi:MAG: adenylate kinase [Chloroflexi bacterium]|nr:adenylate kinase [Chloroflexota bacterium]